MANNFKRIRFFECDQIEDLNKASKGKSRAEESKITIDSKERTIQDIDVIHMIYLDMFFLFLGTPA